MAKTEYGTIIGGYNPFIWDCTSGYKNDTDKKTFIFNLTKKEKFVCTGSEYAVYGDRGYGPTFGGGHDIYICDNANTNRSSYFNFPYSFKRPVKNDEKVKPAERKNSYDSDSDVSYQ